MVWCGSAAGSVDGGFGVGEYTVIWWFGKADPRPPGFYSVLSKSDRPLVRSGGKYVFPIVIQGTAVFIHAFVQAIRCNFIRGKMGRLVLVLLVETYLFSKISSASSLSRIH